MAKHMCAVLMMAATISVVFAQAPAEQGAAFDVVSIRRNTADDHDVRFAILPGGRLMGIAVQPIFLIRQAYEVQPDQILGAPEWVASERYDITATMPGGAALSRAALPALLVQSAFRVSGQADRTRRRRSSDLQVLVATPIDPCCRRRVFNVEHLIGAS